LATDRHIGIGERQQHLRKAVGGDLHVAAIEGALGNDVSLLNERRKQSFTRVAEDVTQSRRHFFHIRPVERVARHHRLDGLVGLIVVADRHETQRPVQVDGLAVLRRRTGREQRIQHRQGAAVVGRGVELTGVC
jgi:hypothetical protein